MYPLVSLPVESVMYSASLSASKAFRAVFVISCESLPVADDVILYATLELKFVLSYL